MIRLLPLLLGLITVGQGVLNRQVASRWGLPATILFNGVILLLPAVAVVLLARSQPHGFPTAPAWQTFRVWFLLPGLLGYLFILGVPWAIGRLGAAQVFVWIVAGQMATSLAYDAVIEGRPLTLPRLGAATLALLAAALIALDAPPPPPAAPPSP